MNRQSESFKAGANWAREQSQQEIAKLQDKLYHQSRRLDENEYMKNIAMNALTAEIASLKAENQRLRDVLKFYATERLYTNVGLQNDLYEDSGKRAREVLKHDNPIQTR